jgi:hypothetical protein
MKITLSEKSVSVLREVEEAQKRLNDFVYAEDVESQNHHEFQRLHENLMECCHKLATNIRYEAMIQS